MTQDTSSQPRIAVFTHDTFGMGHVQRSLRIIGAVSERAPEAAILLITGSPALHKFKNRPANVDYVKIPTIVKTGSPESRPPHLPIPVAEMTLLREQLIRETVLRFDPDVFLVDNFPLGSSRELMAVLHELRARHTKTVLGLRDIVDAPEVVRSDWTRQGIHEVVERFYDHVLVYGMQEVMDVAEAFGLSPGVARKITYCGYVTVEAPPARPAEELRSELGIDGSFLLATGGGGGDSYPLLKTFLEALPGVRHESAVVVTGPLMGNGHREELAARAEALKSVVLLEHIQDLPSYLAAAEAVVTMCGYNLAGEILRCRPRAVVIPRTWRYGEHAKNRNAKVEWEQLLRAQALAKLGVVDLIEPEALAPELLCERLNLILQQPRPTPDTSLELNGRARVADVILGLTGS
jgi:predicted glycosyltransferase